MTLSNNRLFDAAGRQCFQPSNKTFSVDLFFTTENKISLVYLASRAAYLSHTADSNPPHGKTARNLSTFWRGMAARP